MSVGLAMARAIGMPANLEMMLGTMTGMPPGPAAFVLGMMMHLIVAGLSALVYAWAFEHVTYGASAATGALFGAVHGILGGLAMGVIPMMHPLIPEVMPAPGAFMSHLGLAGIMAEMVLHIVYGSVVGALYEPSGVTSHRPVRI